MSVERTQNLLHWVNEQLVVTNSAFEGVASDAGTRRYFRLAHPKHGSLIAVDAVHELESNDAFVKVSGYLKNLGLNVPHIIAYDAQQGFLLLSDLGRQSYLQALSKDTMLSLYQQAIDALVTLQSHDKHEEHHFPYFNEAFMLKELGYFEEWFLAKYLKLVLPNSLKQELTNEFMGLVSAIANQPQVIIHRDYHSRNLLVTQNNNPGIIDFQDMMVGPIMYDVVSLLKDCYIDWPQPSIDSLLRYYIEQARENGLLTKQSEQTVQRWFAWVGVQRHLKVLGIFARLSLRDNKPDYLQYMPRVAMYLKKIIGEHNEFRILNTVFVDYILEDKF